MGINEILAGRDVVKIARHANAADGLAIFE